MISNHSEGTFAPPLHFRRRPPQSNCPPDTVSRVDKTQVRISIQSGRYPTSASTEASARFQRLPPILYKLYQNSISGYSKAPRVFPSCRGNLHLHRYYNFTESLVETVPKSLHLSCGSELTRQGISLP